MLFSQLPFPLTEEDTDAFNWHDSPVYGITFGLGDVRLDVDISVGYDLPSAPSGFVLFSGPATMRFVGGVNVRIEEVQCSGPLTFDGIQREETSRGVEWQLDFFEGYIRLDAPGFSLYFRGEPRRSESWIRSWPHRQSVCFDIPPGPKP